MESSGTGPTGPQSPAEEPQPPQTAPLYPAGPVGSPPPQYPAVNQAPANVAYRQPAQATNGLAIASLVLGILWIFWLGSLLAIIFGHIATGQIDQSGGAQGGRGMAVAGFVLGYIGMGILAVFFIFPFFIALLAASA